MKRKYILIMFFYIFFQMPIFCNCNPDSLYTFYNKEKKIIGDLKARKINDSLFDGNLISLDSSKTKILYLFGNFEKKYFQTYLRSDGSGMSVDGSYFRLLFLGNPISGVQGFFYSKDYKECIGCYSFIIDWIEKCKKFLNPFLDNTIHCY